MIPIYNSGILGMQEDPNIILIISYNYYYREGVHINIGP